MSALGSTSCWPVPLSCWEHCSCYTRAEGGNIDDLRSHVGLWLTVHIGFSLAWCSSPSPFTVS